MECLCIGLLLKIWSVCALSSLSVLHLEHNNLSCLPDGVEGFNLIEELPQTITELKALRIFDASENRLQHIPGEFSQCCKLKSLLLTSDLLKDNLLRKMTSQCNAKAILDYITINSSKSNLAKSKGGKGKKKGKADRMSPVEACQLTIPQDKTDERCMYYQP